MPNYITKNLDEDAVYWALSLPDGAGGFTYAAAVAVNVRWEDTQELFIDAQGRTKISRAVIYIDTDVAVGGMLYHGSIDDLPSDTTDPFADEINGNTFKIESFKKVRRLTRPNEYVRKVWI